MSSLSDAKCEAIIAALEAYDWRGFSCDDIRLIAETIRVYREGEPPHCPTCSCGMPYLCGPSSTKVIHKLNELIALTGPHNSSDTELYWHLVATLEAHRQK